MNKLTSTDRAILDLIGLGLNPGEHVNACRALGFTQTQFAQRLNKLIDTEAALAAYPGLVNRLRRVRSRGRRHLGRIRR